MSALPKTAFVPSAVRVSATMTIAPIDSSVVITGSTLETASIWPLVAAATAPAAVPTPMNDTSSPFNPSFASRCSTIRFVLEPGALTPIFIPLRSLGDL